MEAGTAGGGWICLSARGVDSGTPRGGGQFCVTVTHIFFVFTGLKTVFVHPLELEQRARAPLKTGAHAAPPLPELVLVELLPMLPMVPEMLPARL